MSGADTILNSGEQAALWQRFDAADGRVRRDVEVRLECVAQDIGTHTPAAWRQDGQISRVAGQSRRVPGRGPNHKAHTGCRRANN